MAQAPVDTLKVMTRLESGGFSPEQARAMATTIGETFGGADFVTWKEMEPRLQLLEQRIVIRLAGTMVIVVGLAVTVLHLIH